MLHCRLPVHLERNTSGRSSLRKSALAGLLVAVLLVAATVSVSHSLHQALHPQSSSHGCLICSLAKGQVSAAEVATILAGFSAVLVFLVLRLPGATMAALDRRLAPGRAPPRSASNF